MYFASFCRQAHIAVLNDAFSDPFVCLDCGLDLTSREAALRLVFHGDCGYGCGCAVAHYGI